MAEVHRLPDLGSVDPRPPGTRVVRVVRVVRRVVRVVRRVRVVMGEESGDPGGEEEVGWDWFTISNRQ